MRGKIKNQRLAKDLDKRITPLDLYNIYALVYTYTRIKSKEAKFEVTYELDKYKNKLLCELENIVLRELRHLSGECSSWSYQKATMYSPILNRSLRVKISNILKKAYGGEGDPDDSWDCQRSRKYFKAFMTFKEMNDIIGIEIFNWNSVISFLGEDEDFNWNTQYAGKNWILFAKQSSILEKSSYQELWFTIDRIVNLCHNGGGNFFEKFYYGDALQQSADILSNEKNIESIFNFANKSISESCRKMLRQSV
jgi:hypothetical protein